MELLGVTERRITKKEKGDNVPQLEITEAVLVRCNNVNNQYQYNSRVLRSFVPNRSFGQIVNISRTNHIY